MTPEPARLHRTPAKHPAAPVRIVHLGLGAFHRAHQAYFTAHAADAADWGIAAFTGRAGPAAKALVSTLNEQEGLYTLTERGPEGDTTELIDSLVAAHTGDDLHALFHYLRSPHTAIVMLTVTEAGYRLDPSRRPLVDDPIVVSDLNELRRGGSAVQSSLAVLARGLDERRRGGGGPVTVVPCDNIPDNGDVAKAGLLAFASAIGTDTVDWIDGHVSFVSTSVDRITPRFSDEDLQTAREAGWADSAPVVTEPFVNWVLAGQFVAGRPMWESAGAQFVTDLAPYENRKLWLLNGAHTAMANLGRARGLATVAQATADPECRELVEGFWSEAVRHLPAEVDAQHYCRDLWARFENPRIAHLLDQIAEDSLAKLRVRVVPVALAELDAGRGAYGCARVVASWVANVASKAGRRDALQGEIDRALALPDQVRALVTLVSARLGSDGHFVARVRAAAGTESARPPARRL